MKGVLLTFFAVLLFLSVSSVLASHQPAAVEVGIWLHGAPDITPINNLETSLGIKFKAAKWYQDWDDAWRSWIPTGYHNAGYTPEMSWQPMITQPDGSNLGVANTDILAGRYDAFLDSTATSIKALPFRLRISFGNEFNGPWNPWGLGKVGNTIENHKLAWRYVVDRFKQKGANNIDWIWTPNIDPDHLLPSFASLYPGDAYVTYFGLDGYNFGTSLPGGRWQSFRSLYQSSYDELLAISNKDIYIIEMGSVEQGGDKAQWIKEMFDDLESRYPKIKSLTWWNVAYPQYDMRLQTSGAAMGQFGLSVNGPAAGSGGGISSGGGTTGGGTSTGGSGTGTTTSGGSTGSTGGSVTNQTQGGSIALGNPLAPANYSPKNDTKRPPISPPPTNTETPDTGFTLPRYLKGETTVNPKIVAGLALALIALLVTFCYLVARQGLSRAAKLDAAEKAAEDELKRRASGY